NGLQRIGVILSILWAAFVLFAAISEYNSSAHHGPFVESVAVGPDPAGLERIDLVKKDGTRTSGTWNELTGQTAMLTETRLKFGPLLFWLLAPIVASWLLIYMLIFSVRWVVAGFKARA